MAAAVLKSREDMASAIALENLVSSDGASDRIVAAVPLLMTKREKFKEKLMWINKTRR